MARDRVGTAGIIVALTCLIILACAVERESHIREPIEMGPWKFHVDRVSDIIESNAGDQFRIVIIELELENYMERHEKTFDDFLNGNRLGAFIAFPRVKLIDKDGTDFGGWATPGSGGSLRSEWWTLRIRLVPDSIVNMISDADLARPYLDRDLNDFRLVITNPDPRPGQPGSVSIRLK